MSSDRISGSLSGPLAGRVAVVAGATRGAGCGIARPGDHGGRARHPRSRRPHDRARGGQAGDARAARKSGGLFTSWALAEEYGFDDVDGARPHWGRYFAEHVGAMPSGPPGTAMRWTLERAREAAPAKLPARLLPGHEREISAARCRVAA